MKIDIKTWLLGATFGALVALSVAVPPTFLDWSLNPGGLFRSDSGTNWDAVFETLLSWFWPIFIVATTILTLFFTWLTKKKSSDPS